MPAGTLNKLRPLANDIPITLILTDRYNEDISADKNQLWLKSQDLSTKMFANENVEVIRMKGTALEVLFNKNKAIEKLIMKSIKQWKQKSKINSKY